MAQKYTYEDFLKALESSGYSGRFSDADMKTAQSNPDFGMSILELAKRYNSTTDKNEQARLHQMGEKLRASYGGYSGGNDGSSFTLTPQSPKDFTYSEAPTYQSRYDDRIQELLNALTNRESFSYDAERDPLYSQYRKQYIREGKRATEDTMGAAASMSGGLPTSYAATAAAQAGNYYNAQLTDKIPELEQLAYQKYKDEFSMDRSKLQAVQDAEQADYQKYLTDLGQYNTDRELEYNRFMSELSSQRQDTDDAWTRAQTAAGYGDYSGLDRLGVDTSSFRSQQERDRAMEEAQLRAQYGDLSGLRELGVDTSAYERQLAAQAASGSSSGSGGSRQTGGEWTSLVSRMEAAGVKTGADAYSYALDMGYSASEAKQIQENWEKLNSPEEEAVNPLEAAIRAGVSDRGSAVAYYLGQGYSLDEAYEMAGTLEEMGFDTSGDTATANAADKGIKDPGPNASNRDRFLYSFTMSARNGTDLDNLYSQLEVAVENGWITEKEAQSLRANAQINYAMFFSKK